METYTLAHAVQTVKKIVEDSGPDYVYNGRYELKCRRENDRNFIGSTVECFYRHNSENGSAGCLIGHYIAETLGEVPDYIENRNAEAALDLIAVNHKDAPHWSKLAKEFLVRVQVYQDDGFTWGDSLRKGARRAFRYFASLTPDQANEIDAAWLYIEPLLDHTTKERIEYLLNHVKE